MDPDRSLRRLSPPRRQAREEARANAQKKAPQIPGVKEVPAPKARLGVPHPTAEEFEAWAQDPVTRFVATAYAFSAALNEEAWRQLSWVQGQADPLKLVELRSRSDAYKAFLTVGHARYCEIIDLNKETMR